MADRRDYYFRQKVTEAELDAGFDGMEQADFDLSVDHDLVGIVDGMGVAEKSGTPDLTVDVAGPGSAYTKQGERISFASLQNVDLSVDDGAVSTAVAAPGNSRVISLFIEFDRLLSDPRIDGNSLTVFHVRDESFNFSVIAGGEATTGLEVPPALDPNKLLLADVTIDFGQTQILNADVGVLRREDAFRLTGTLALVAGTPKEAIADLLTGLNLHIDGGGLNHPAGDLDYGGAGNWAGGITDQAQAAVTVEAGLDGIVSDLADIGADSGADKIGIRASVNQWHDGNGFLSGNVWGVVNGILQVLGATAIGNGGADKIGAAVPSNAFHDGANLAAGSVWDQISEFIGALAGTTTGGGADLIGSQGQTVGSESTTAGSIFDQIGELLTRLDLKATLALVGQLAAANNWTGQNTIDGLPINFTNLLGASGISEPLLDDDREHPEGTNDFLLWFKFGPGASNATYDHTIRFYHNEFAQGIAITQNARWDNDTNLWRSDAPGHAQIWRLANGLPFQSEYRRPAPGGAGVTWDDNSWNTTAPLGSDFHIQVLASLTDLRLRDGRVDLNPTANANSNLPNGTQANANSLYAKNIPKAWGKFLGQTLSDETFNVTSIVASASGALVTFARAAPGSFDSCAVASGSGTSVTTAHWLTVDSYTTNTVLVRAWRWNGAAIVEEPIAGDDWSLVQFARHTG